MFKGQGISSSTRASQSAKKIFSAKQMCDPEEALPNKSKMIWLENQDGNISIQFALVQWKNQDAIQVSITPLLSNMVIYTNEFFEPLVPAITYSKTISCLGNYKILQANALCNWRKNEKLKVIFLIYTNICSRNNKITFVPRNNHYHYQQVGFVLCTRKRSRH